MVWYQFVPLKRFSGVISMAGLFLQLGHFSVHKSKTLLSYFSKNFFFILRDCAFSNLKILIIKIRANAMV